VIPEHVLRVVATLAFVVMGLFVAREAVRTRASASGEGCDYAASGQGGCEPSAAWDWRAFGSTLGLLFVAEMGDKTQLAVLGLAGKSEIPWFVFLGGTLALVSVTALGVVGGQGLCKLIPERLLLWASAVSFVVMGLLMGFGIL
jgi:putative Ca2+/H+ antiporter (TMEM165/GDT1 family)